VDRHEHKGLALGDFQGHHESNRMHKRSVRELLAVMLWSLSRTSNSVARVAIVSWGGGYWSIIGCDVTVGAQWANKTFPDRETFR